MRSLASRKFCRLNLSKRYFLACTQTAPTRATRAKLVSQQGEISSIDRVSRKAKVFMVSIAFSLGINAAPAQRTFDIEIIWKSHH